MGTGASRRGGSAAIGGVANRGAARRVRDRNRLRRNVGSARRADDGDCHKSHIGRGCYAAIGGSGFRANGLDRGGNRLRKAAGICRTVGAGASRRARGAAISGIANRSAARRIRDRDGLRRGIATAVGANDGNRYGWRGMARAMPEESELKKNYRESEY